MTAAEIFFIVLGLIVLISTTWIVIQNIREKRWEKKHPHHLRRTEYPEGHNGHTWQ